MRWDGTSLKRGEPDAIQSSIVELLAVPYWRGCPPEAGGVDEGCRWDWVAGPGVTFPTNLGNIHTFVRLRCLRIV